MFRRFGSDDTYLQYASLWDVLDVWSFFIEVYGHVLKVKCFLIGSLLYLEKKINQDYIQTKPKKYHQKLFHKLKTDISMIRNTEIHFCTVVDGDIGVINP